MFNLPTFYEDKGLVTPGDLIAEGNYLVGENTYKDDGKIYASRIGLVDYNKRRIHVVALKAFYIPRIGDVVIGKVVDVGLSGWMVDVKAPYPALLRASDALGRSYRPQKDDLSSIFDVGDLIISEVVAYDRTRGPLLSVHESGLGKITRGQIVEVTPTKIPRIIGRKGSMISIIKKETGCHITIGQNGLILVSGKSFEHEKLAVMAIRKIEKESHTSGLTNHVTEMLRRGKEEIERV